jgi:YHS domain-containing protein
LELDQENSKKHAGLGSAKWFFCPEHFLQSFAQDGERYSKVLAREECNKLDLTAGPCHWPIVMIGPGGLLLVVSHLFGWRPGFNFYGCAPHTCKKHSFSLNLAAAG